MLEPRVTNCYIDYELIDVSAETDSHTTTNTAVQSFSTVHPIYKKCNRNVYDKLMTLEHNFSVLDGTYKEFPSDTPQKISYFSAVKSNGSGLFETNPIITINFSTTHASYGLQISFLDDYPTHIIVRWRLNDTIINVADVYPTSKDCDVKVDVFGYNRIELEFVQAQPYRLIKLDTVKFGMSVRWGEDNLKTATALHENNVLSKSFPVDTLNFEVVDVTNSLNIGNVDGIHRYFQRNQPMFVYEKINDTEIFVGRYFLNTLSEQNNLVKMSAQSYLGIMSDVLFDKGRLYSGVYAGNVLEQIFKTAGITNYRIDGDTYYQPLYGALPIMTCREAISQILFACHSLIDSRTETVVTYKNDTTVDSVITKETKFSTKPVQSPYVHAVRLTYSNYVLGSQVEQIMSGTFERGIHRVEFSEPVRTITTITGASVIEFNPFYCMINVTSNGDVTISGRIFHEVKNSVMARRKDLPPGQVETMEEYETTLCNARTATILAEKILSYKQLSLQVDVKHIANDVNMRNRHVIENPIGDFDNYTGMFVKRSFDLTGGFLDQARIDASPVESRTYYYTGTEIITNDNIII